MGDPAVSRTFGPLRRPATHSSASRANPPPTIRPAAFLVPGSLPPRAARVKGGRVRARSHSARDTLAVPLATRSDEGDWSRELLRDGCDRIHRPPPRGAVAEARGDRLRARARGVARPA